jgi:dipeptidyl aminopeptidase/acylaminoacyl peptidase
MILRRPRRALLAATPFALLLAISAAALSAQTPYREPPADIVRILDAAPLPAASVSPDRRWLLLMEQQAMPGIEELAAPMLRLAGNRIDPVTNGPHRAGRITGMVLQPVAGGAERRLRLPAGAAAGNVRWSPDDRRLAFTNTTSSALELWVADVATGEARRVTDARLNGTAGAPCDWLPDGRRLLCRFVPEDRGPEPVRRPVPVGPVVQEARGRAAPVRTFQDLLADAHDEALYDHYFTSQLALVDVATGTRTAVGAPAVIDAFDASPDGRFILVSTTVRPYSYRVPDWVFPRTVEVWDLEGRVLHEVAALPLAEDIPPRGVGSGSGRRGWREATTATLVWAEALDEGDPSRQVPHRDRVVLLPAPFTAPPVELTRLEHRFGGAAWTEGDVVSVSEFDIVRRWRRTHLLDARRPGQPGRGLWDMSAEDRYNAPGSPLFRRSAAGGSVLLQRGDWIYLTGAGASPQGDRPFLDRFNLRTLRTERLWRNAGDRYESVVAVLDDEARRIVTRRESPTEPPNYFVVERGSGRAAALTAFPDPAPELTGISRQLVTYERADGVPLSGTLYLPPGHRPGERLPVVMWAYPREFADPAAAGQVSAAPNRFTFIRGSSHLFFLTQGYAVFDGPSMPILGGDTANDTYVEQLVASARAAVDRLVELGIADPDRIGVGGHSYGAFMTANLLAHSDLFRAGIARSGAYNRTLTPFGFQAERRTFWEAPAVYDRMSPFHNAHRIRDPILLIHGAVDNNSGTFPVQSERLFEALAGLGGTARLVMLPHESHGYAARESVLHALAEMVDWFDRHVKNAPRRAVTN